jgi:hypothetical protein
MNKLSGRARKNRQGVFQNRVLRKIEKTTGDWTQIVQLGSS